MYKEYDKNGKYVGMVEDDGRRFEYQGKIEKNGDIFDREGNCAGRIEKDGKIFDNNEKFIGYIETNESSSGTGCFAIIVGMICVAIAILLFGYK